jgi:hypothetical protein
MSTIIQIKRSTGSAAPTTATLVEGELAYSEDRTNNGAGAILYIESVASDGTTQVIDKIGGKYYTNTVDELLNPATSSVAGSVDFFEAGTNGSNKITLTVPTNLAANATYTLPAAPTANHFLQTDGNGVLSWEEVVSNLDIAGDTGTDTLNTGETLTFTGTANQIATSVTNNVVTFALTNDVTLVGDLTVGGQDIKSSNGTVALTLADTTGNVTVAGDLIVGGQDIKSANGTTAITLADTTGNVTVAGDLTVTGNDIKSSTNTALTLTGSDVEVLGDLTVTGNDIKSSTATALALSGADVEVKGDLQVTGNDIKSSSGSSALTLSGVDVTVNGDLQVTGNDIKSSTGATAITLSGQNVTVNGDLTVNGNTTVVNSTTVTIDDTLLKLGDGNIGNSVDTGVYAQYYSTNTKYAGWFRDASDNDIFKFFKGLEVEPTTTVNVSGTGYAVGTILANLTGGTVSSLASAIAVGDGGTGATTFTTNGVLYGNGTGAIQATAQGTTGYFLYSNAGTPAWTNVVDGGTY